MLGKLIIFAISAQLIFMVLNYVYEVSTREQREAEAQLIKDKATCGKRTPNRLASVLYCRCSDKESQKPGKCSEKYK